jgi:serine/threonine protein kinase
MLSPDIAADHVGAGTLPYMAPELLVGGLADGSALISPTNRVDVYSLGMIMYEMLTGRVPWQGLHEAAITAAVRCISLLVSWCSAGNMSVR